MALRCAKIAARTAESGRAGARLACSSRLGDELARGRMAAGFSSQQGLADHLGFDRSVIGKAETGDRPPTPDVLAAWCKACQLDYEHFARMATLARRADGPIPRWFETWLAAEAQATMLKYWSPIIVPALFHTAGYLVRSCWPLRPIPAMRR